jgi:hypothetical protein
MNGQHKDEDVIYGGIKLLKRYKYLLFLMIAFLLSSGCHLFSINGRITKSLGIDIPQDLEIPYEDTHGALGDGDTFAVVDFNEDTAEDFLISISENTDWYPLPLSENLSIMLYGGEKEGVNYSYSYAEEFNIPAALNGYWFFNNRHAKRISPKDDSNLLELSSANFTLAIFDVDTSTLYYWEYDS